MFKQILPILVLIAAFWQVAAGGLFSIDAFTGNTYNGLLTLIQPAGFIFSIWGLIYTLSFVYAIYQLFPKNNNSFLERSRPYVLFGFLGSGSWLWFAGLSNSWVWLTVPVLVVVACLFFEAIKSPEVKKLNGWSKFFSYSTLLPYAAWTAIAQVVNLHSIFNQYALIPSQNLNVVVGAVLLLVIAVITLRSLAISHYSVWYLGVILWASFGIGYANYFESAGSVVVILLAIALFVVACGKTIFCRYESK